jgi:hypothetical protein
LILLEDFVKSRIFNRLLSAFCTVFSLNVAVADSSGLYLGLDALKTNYAMQDRFASNIFGTVSTGLNAFVGYQLPRNFFAEAGYEFDKPKTNTATIKDFDFYPGEIAPRDNPGEFQTYKSKLKITHPYLGAGYNYYFCDSCAYFSVFAGVSRTKVKASFDLIGYDLPLTPELVAGNHRDFKKSKIAPMIRLALNYGISEAVTVRLTGTWRKLNDFRIDSPTSNTDEAFAPSAIIKLKNGYTAGLGLFYNF